MIRTGWALCLCLWAFSAHAQLVPHREIEAVKSLFDAGNYQQALQRSKDALALANFTGPQRVELHKYCGLSSYHLGNQTQAEEHFLQLLKLNPDAILDPFAVPPKAIKIFDEVKRKNADTLNLVRQQIALREEQTMRETQEREKKAAEELQKKQTEEAQKAQPSKVVEKRSLLPNFVPFGVGQFVQGRTEWGVAFALTEAVLAIASLIGYWAAESLYTTEMRVPGVLYGGGPDGKHSIPVRQISPERLGQFRALNAVKWVTGVGFYAVAVAGIVEALLHHKGSSITFQNQTLTLHPVVLPNGAGMGVSFDF